ncbi:MAG: indoleamine 2,3-dioxygenase [Alphaproteobacteria bacterium]|nr:indoleamine 2,3-dioxygenase [Alphaproteobacteria bacterium]
MPANLNLSDYDISKERGYLCAYDAASVTLPSLLAPAVEAAQALPRTLLTGRVRRFLSALPVPDLAGFCAEASDPELRSAMVRYSFMVQAYVWGEAEAPTSLPAPLAVPIWALAKRLGQQPLLPYSAYVLDNWDRIDRKGPIALDNIWMIQNFLAGQDEAWFVLVHVAIEARAGEMLAEIPALIEAADRQDASAVETSLARIRGVWDDVNAIFDRMPERCDPYIYFQRVRPYIHGWKDNPALGPGLVYEGVAETGGKPQAFRGQTGSQSSIVPAMDALFGIGHAGDPLRTFLDELHIYRPPAHRAFIDAVRARSGLRSYVEAAGSPVLRELYNDCVMRLTRFRTRHLEYAASYIHKQAKDTAGNDTDVGTGGTPFMKYLKKHRDEAEAHLLRG